LKHFKRKVVHRFMHAAAIAFAVGAHGANAGGDSATTGSNGDRKHERRISRKSAEADYALYLGPERGALGDAAAGPMQVRVLDRLGRCALAATVSGECRLGPLAAGEYIVLVRRAGRTDAHRVTLGAAPVIPVLLPPAA
jgi:hypothetical protein